MSWLFGLAWSESQSKKKKCRITLTSNYFEYFLVFASAVTGCDSVDVPVSTASSEVGIKICAITAGIKKYKSIIKEKMGKT